MKTANLAILLTSIVVNAEICLGQTSSEHAPGSMSNKNEPVNQVTKEGTNQEVRPQSQAKPSHKPTERTGEGDALIKQAKLQPSLPGKQSTSDKTTDGKQTSAVENKSEVQKTKAQTDVQVQKVVVKKDLNEDLNKDVKKDSSASQVFEAINLKLSPVRLEKIDFDGGLELGLNKKISVGIYLAGKGLDNYSEAENVNLSLKEKNPSSDELLKTRYLSSSVSGTYYVNEINSSNFYFRLLASFAVLEGKLNKKSGEIEGSSVTIDQSNTMSILKGISPTVGYQWLWENGFNINFGFGPTFYRAKPLEINYTNQETDRSFSIERRYGNDIFPYANVTIGLML